MDSIKYKLFLKTFAIILFSLIYSLALINFIIDPFGIYGFPQIERVNKAKTEMDKHERLFKAVQIAKRRPLSLLLGSSRVMAGFDPHDLEMIVNVPSYNGAFSGAVFEEQYHYFEHALYHQPNLQVIILGLDLFGFSQQAKPLGDFTLERLKGLPISWRDFYSSLFSFPSLLTSYTTFKKNFYQNPLNSILDNGQTNPAISSCSVSNPILKRGDLVYLKTNTLIHYTNYKFDEEKIELFRKLVQTCQDRSINLKVFFCPSQAVYWELVYRQEVWPVFEELKRKLSSIYPIWDFSGFNSVTTRAIEKNHPFYYECSHFTPYVGKMILDRLFDRSHAPSDFGFLLTPATIEHTFIRMREQAQPWLKEHPNILDQLKDIPDHVTW